MCSTPGDKEVKKYFSKENLQTLPWGNQSQFKIKDLSSRMKAVKKHMIKTSISRILTVYHHLLCHNTYNTMPTLQEKLKIKCVQWSLKELKYPIDYTAMESVIFRDD